MPRLEHTRVYRGGFTSNRLRFERTQCRYWADEQNLNFEFLIDSKGAE